MQAPLKSFAIPGDSLAPDATAGQIVGRTAEGQLIVDFDGSPAGPKPARTAISHREAEAFYTGTPVLLLFENRNPDLPIIVGRLSSGNLDITMDFAGRGPNHEPGNAVKEHIVLEAQQEIVLRCGRSSLTLQRDGKIVLRGRDLISRASRRNRIQGGSVDIN